jgi:pyruvate/2-oxoglutarate dehydrogenase complex dihydrolipoamide acyltransferase (E2) component
MGRKILNRKELREENETAERAAAAQPKAAAKKAPAKRKSRAKVVKEVRLKAFWGVFNQSMRRMALFEYSQRKEADKKAADLSESQKSPHFVQIVKEVIEE